MLNLFFPERRVTGINNRFTPKPLRFLLVVLLSNHTQGNTIPALYILVGGIDIPDIYGSCSISPIMVTILVLKN